MENILLTLWKLAGWKVKLFIAFGNSKRSQKIVKKCEHRITRTNLNKEKIRDTNHQKNIRCEIFVQDWIGFVVILQRNWGFSDGPCENVDFGLRIVVNFLYDSNSKRDGDHVDVTKALEWVRNESEEILNYSNKQPSKLSTSNHIRSIVGRYVITYVI